MSDDEIPNLIAYNPMKKSQAKLIGRFDKEAVQLFVEKTFKGHVSYQGLNLNDFKIRKTVCSEEHVRIEERRLEALKEAEE
mmetsp:Transcript_12639/g.1879  ORF Transcript_12639/g.1879 Transcript_12639/m.1879 type:complete len:81 (+) Transcript_12639:249-491(+)